MSGVRRPVEHGLPPENAHSGHGHGHGLRAEFLAGLVITAVVVGINHQIEHTGVGRWLELMMYDFLQFRLQTELPAHRMPITVVDIRDLPGPDSPGRLTPVTPRRNLEEILLALHDCGAQAVGVDIDASPPAGEPLGPADRHFFETCLKLRTLGMPVFLGVHRRLDRPSRDWLGAGEYAPLAVNLEIPTEVEMEHVENSPEQEGAATAVGVRSMPLYLRLKPDGERINSLGLALAAPAGGATVRSLPKPPRLLRWALRRTSEFRETPLIQAELFLVDYGALEGFDRYAVRAINRAGLLQNAQALKGKLVLVGDASLNHQDLHSVPDRRQPVPGVFIHASAAWTLRHAPIYELTPAGRITIDFVLASAIMLITFWSGPLVSRYWPKLPEHQIEQRVSWWVCILAFTVGVVLVHWTRVMWDDFIFVILGLLVLHGWVKQVFVRFWSGTRLLSARLFPTKTRS